MNRPWRAVSAGKDLSGLGARPLGWGRAWANLSLRGKGLWVIAAPIVALFAIVILNHTTLQAQTQASARVLHSLEVNSEIHELHSLLAEAATGVRGYLLTGKTRFLAPYQTARAHLPETLARLDELVADNREQHARAKLASTLAASQLTLLEALLTPRGGPGDASQEDLLESHKVALDVLRGVLRSMTEAEAALLEVRQAHAARLEQRGATLGVLGLLGGLGSGLVAVFLFTGGIARRAEQAAENARRLARAASLLPLLPGDDALARLDHALQETATILATQTAALKESEAHLRSVVGAAPVVLFALDPEGVFTLSRGKGLEVLGLLPDEVVGRSIFEVYADTPTITDDIRRALAGEHLSTTLEVAGVAFMSHYTPLKSDGGAVVGVIGVSTDITHQRKAEQALEQQRDFAHQVMTTMGQGLTVTDVEGLFEYVNPAFARMLGRPAAELIGCSPLEFVSAADRAAMAGVREARFAGESSSYEVRNVRADGSLIPVLITGVPRYQQGKIVGSVAVITDLSERDALETERRIYQRGLEQANAELVRTNRLKSEFLANMSHELRTPLTAVIGFSELLAEEFCGPLNAKQKQYASDIHGAGTHLLSLINDILDLSKVEAGKLELDSTPSELVPLVESVVRVMQERALRHGLALEATFPLLLAPLVLDARKVTQVLYNLLSNAVKFTPAGGRVEVTVSDTPHEVCVEVTDTGPGIAPDDQRKLFTPFTQLDSSLTKQHEGTGLGLALTKRLVELHGGRVWLTSTLGHGSTFGFSLPRVAHAPLPPEEAVIAAS